MHVRRTAMMVLPLAAAAVLQSTLGEMFAFLRARPDLVLLLVVMVSVVRGVEEGMLAGILGGLMVDMLSAVPFGAASIGLGLIGLATGLGESNIYRSNVIIPLIAMFLATVVYHSFLMLALQAAGWNVEWISTLVLQTIPGATLNSLLVPLALPLVRRLLLPVESRERIGW